MDLPGAEGGQDVGLVGDDAEGDRVHVRLALLEVVGVLLQQELLLDLPVLEDEGPSAESRLVEVAVLLHARLADDVAPEAAEGGEESRERFLGHELDAVLPRRLDLVPRDEVLLARRELEEPVEGELHVGGGPLLAIVEFPPLPELEVPRKPVWANLP